jgi:hypothetical protein
MVTGRRVVTSATPDDELVAPVTAPAMVLDVELSRPDPILWSPLGSYSDEERMVSICWCCCGAKRESQKLGEAAIIEAGGWQRRREAYKGHSGQVLAVEFIR